MKPRLLYALLFSVATFIISATTASAGPGTACFFERPNLGGGNYCLYTGDYPRLERAQRQVGSIQVHIQTRITVCSRANFHGQCEVFEENQPRLQGDLAVRIRSVRIELLAAAGNGGNGGNAGNGGNGGQAARGDAVCIYRQVGFGGDPACYSADRIRRVPNTGAARSLAVPRGVYLFGCTLPDFRGDCRKINGDTADISRSFSRDGLGSMVVIPTRLAPGVAFENIRGYSVDVGLTTGVDLEQQAHTNTARLHDIEIFMSEQGKAIRPINGARMFQHIDQEGGLSVNHLYSCMAQANASDRFTSRYALGSQTPPGFKLCILTRDGKYALIEVLRPNVSPANKVVNLRWFTTQ